MDAAEDDVSTVSRRSGKLAELEAISPQVGESDYSILLIVVAQD